MKQQSEIKEGQFNKVNKIFVSDFETVTFKGQSYTEVWAAGICDITSEKVHIFNTLQNYIAYVKHLAKFGNIFVYFHNAKFDCSFLLDYFLRSPLYNCAVTGNLEDLNIRFLDKKHMPNNSFTYTFSDKGQFYKLTLKVHSHIVEFIDSLKLLPFSVKTIEKNFSTRASKGEIDYSRHRHAGEEITPEEKEYLENDILVVKEALLFMFENGHTKLTIGSCCIAEFKKLYDPYWKNSDTMVPITYRNYEYEMDFPDLMEEKSPKESINLWDYIHESYRGAWCYVKDNITGKLIKKGLTLDVNSLYPSVMHSESGNYYPVGKGQIFYREIPEKVKDKTRYYYFVRIRTRFYLKEGYLPFIQIKNNFLYKGNEMLKTSDILNKRDGKYYKYYRDKEGNAKPAIVELTLTCTDFERIQEFYRLEDLEILDGVYFNAKLGIFDHYINKYAKLKINATNKAERQLAKLFLNNLYGKLASTSCSSFKYAVIDPKTDALKFYNIPAYDKKPGYIPCGAAITSYARDFIIRKAQANYKYFCYADTDSLHLNCSITDVKDCKLDSKKFLCFKCETEWTEAIFIRQKCYIEHVYSEDFEIKDHPYYNIICAGMPDNCKNKIQKYLYNGKDGKIFRITDFKKGLEVTGKLQQSYIKGGMILSETSYKIKEEIWRI